MIADPQGFFNHIVENYHTPPSTVEKRTRLTRTQVITASKWDISKYEMRAVMRVYAMYTDAYYEPTKPSEQALAQIKHIAKKSPAFIVSVTNGFMAMFGGPSKLRDKQLAKYAPVRDYLQTLREE